MPVHLRDSKSIRNAIALAIFVDSTSHRQPDEPNSFMNAWHLHQTTSPLLVQPRAHAKRPVFLVKACRR